MKLKGPAVLKFFGAAGPFGFQTFALFYIDFIETTLGPEKDDLPLLY